jgi:dTDP-glucose pyrophosphorylase
MKSCGISDVIIVIGHLGHTIVGALGDGSRQGISIRYVEQRETLGIAHAVGNLERYIDSPFILFLGDIYFIADDLRPMIEEVLSGDVNAHLVSKIETDPEMIKRNFAIIENRGNRVQRVIEKPRYVRSRFKGCGIYIFDQYIFDAIRRTPRTAMRDEYEITESIQIMINDGLSVCHFPAVKYDINLTVPNDLLKINLVDLKRKNLRKLIGKDSQIPEGTLIENSVIGDDVTVKYPTHIKNSLVFAGSQVNNENNNDSVIIHEDNIIFCNGRDFIETDV